MGIIKTPDITKNYKIKINDEVISSIPPVIPFSGSTGS